MGFKSWLFLKLMWMGKRRNLAAAKRGFIPSAAQVRANTRKVSGIIRFLQPTRKDVVIHDENLAGVPCWRVVPKKETQRVILYLHGGGYVLGLRDFDVYTSLVAELAASADAEVFAIDYRTAPENPFPAALEDAYKAYLAILERGIAASRIVVSGDSAGGGLTLALLMKLRDTGKPLPAAALPISPWTDLAATGESHKSRLDRDPFFTEQFLPFMAGMTLDGQSATEPYVSPLYGSYAGLPPLMITVGGDEILFDDSRSVVQKAKAAGVDTTFIVEEDMPHIYPVLFAIFPEGKETLQEMVAFMKKHTA